MDQRKLTFLITHLILRIRDYPPEAVEELLGVLDKIERKYDLIEKLTAQEWEAVIESREGLAWAEGRSTRPVYENPTLTKADFDAWGAQGFEDAVTRVRLRAGEQQGDIADVIFALLDEYLWYPPSSNEKPSTRPE